MDNMSEFFSVMLHLISDFLASDPIIYVFGLVLLLMVVEIFRRLMSP